MLSIILMLMVNSVMLSYLIDRSQHVVLDTFSSQPFRLSCGVPQDSVLGQMLISLYISPLEDVIRAHGLNAMMYADDFQLYIIMRQSNLAKISCPSLTCLNVTQRRPKSFTSPHFLHRPSQFHFLIFFFEIVLPQKRKLDPLKLQVPQTSAQGK